MKKHSPRSNGRNNARAAILEAADRILVRHGFARLTLDEVANEAHISKGGLLYHFPSKNDLMVGLVEDGISRFDKRIADRQSKNGKGETWAQAWVRVCTAPRSSGRKRRLAALTTAGSIYPHLVDPQRKLQKIWKQRLLEEDVDPVYAALLPILTVGWGVCEIFDYPLPEGHLREQVINELLKFCSKSPKR